MSPLHPSGKPYLSKSEIDVKLHCSDYFKTALHKGYKRSGTSCGGIDPYTLMALHGPYLQRRPDQTCGTQRAPHGNHIVPYCLSRHVTLSTGLYKVGRDPPQGQPEHTRIYPIQYNRTHDVGITPPRRPNLYKSCVLCLCYHLVHVLRTSTTLNLLPWGYPMVDCRV